MDNWGHGITRHKFPELYSFATKDTLSIQEFLQQANISDNFFLPLSAQAHNQFTELQNTLDSLPPSNHGDKWTYPWGTSYSSIKMYKELTKGQQAAPLFQKLWKNATMLRYKIFFWLLLHDRVNTRNMLQRRSFHLPSYNCALCQMNTFFGTVTLHGHVGTRFYPTDLRASPVWMRFAS